MFKGSPKTAIAGWAAVVAAIATALAHQFDNDPATIADWSVTIGLLVAGFSGIFARDNSTTSEEVKKAGG